MTSCPNCNICDCSYTPPTEDDPEVVIRCNNCGTEWAEPNQLYIGARKREVEEQYFDRFDRR